VPETAALARNFRDEAASIWEAQKQSNEAATITAVATAGFLSLDALCNGMESKGVQYISDAVDMGTSMGLFGVDSVGSSARSWLDNYQDWIRAASQTAWGIFVWTRQVNPPLFHFSPYSLWILSLEEEVKC
jgi:hypothetical protein